LAALIVSAEWKCHTPAVELFVSSRLTIPAAELSVSSSRASGPGGQHVNKTETKIELRWSVATTRALSDGDRNRLMSRLGSRLTTSRELIVVCSETRSRSRNLEIARERFAGIVAAALIPPKRRVRTRPSRGAVERRLEKKRKRSSKKRERRWRHDRS